MMRSLFVAAILSLSAWAAAEEPHRSPVDLALSPDGKWIVTANQSSNTASLVRVEDGQVVAETPVGEHPSAVVFTADGRLALVTGSYSGDLTLLKIEDEKLERIGNVRLGHEPYGVAVSPQGDLAYVALFADDSVAVVDLVRREEV